MDWKDKRIAELEKRVAELEALAAKLLKNSSSSSKPPSSDIVTVHNPTHFTQTYLVIARQWHNNPGFREEDKMKTIPRNEELNASIERAVKSVNDEFVRQCVERQKQEQAQGRQRDIQASAAEMPRQVESGNN